MVSVPTNTLHELADGVFVWIQPGGESGVSNAGAIVDDDGITVVDTLMVRSQWEPFAAAVAGLGRPVRRLVLTHAHIDHVGGSRAFANASVLGSQQTSDAPRRRDAARRVQGVHARVRRRVRRARRDRAPGPVTHLVTDAAQLTPRVELLPANGHTDGDVMVLVADADVLFAGDLCFFGVTPLAFQGNPETWANVLDVVGELADTIVPGHGPIGGEPEIRALQQYLRHCVAVARGEQAAIPPGPWDTWPERDPRDAINIERAALLAAGQDVMPNSMLKAMGFG